MPKVSKNCEICGDKYEVYPSQMKKRHTCGKKECTSKYLSKIHGGDKISGWNDWEGGKVKKICPICGDDYFVVKCLEYKIHTCRKKECTSQWKSQTRSGKNHHNWKGGKVIQICEICGDDYSIDKCEIEKRHTCGKKECISKWRSKIHGGDKISGWNDWEGGKVTQICEICGDEYSGSIAHMKKRHTCGKLECYSKWTSMRLQGIKNPDDWEGYAIPKQYCEKWTTDLRRRIRFFFGNRSILSGKTLNENKNKRLGCHHVYYQKKACCGWDEDEQGYFAIIDRERYYIGDDPNKFIPLTNSEHAKVMKNKINWVKIFEDIIRKRFNGVSYYTREEYDWIMKNDPTLNEFSHVTGTYFPSDFDHGRATS